MSKINRMMSNICSDRIEESKEFYTKLFDFKINYDSDWFVQLVSADGHFELGIIDRTSQIIPSDFQKQPQGVYITFVVESADDLFEIAKAENFQIIQEPTDTEYGQRRLLLKDPDGTMIDISSLIPDFKFAG